MNKLTYVQIFKGNESLFKIAKELWIPFIKEVNSHDNTMQKEEEIINNLMKRIAIQGNRKDMHFEIAFYNKIPIGIAMFAIDLGTVYGLLKKGYGTIMGFYIHPAYRQRGFGKEFWIHIENILSKDGATEFYICPDRITGKPFWESLGFKDSGLIDPDDNKPIFIKPQP